MQCLAELSIGIPKSIKGRPVDLFCQPVTAPVYFQRRRRNQEPVYLKLGFCGLRTRIFQPVLTPLLMTALDRLDGLFGGQNRVGQKGVVNKRRVIAGAPLGMLRPRRRIFYHRYLKTLLDQFA